MVEDDDPVGRSSGWTRYLRIRFDPLLSYLLGKQILYEMGGWSEVNGQIVAQELEGSAGSELLRSGIEHLLHDAVRQNRYELIVGTADAVSSRHAVTYMRQIIVSCELLGIDTFKLVVSTIAEKTTQRERAALILSTAGDDLYDRRQWVAAVVAYKEAQAIYRRLVDDGHTELRKELATVSVNLGVALDNQVSSRRGGIARAGFDSLHSPGHDRTPSSSET